MQLAAAQPPVPPGGSHASSANAKSPQTPAEQTPGAEDVRTEAPAHSAGGAASHTIAVPAHVAPAQASPFVQGSPSSHAPARAECVQVPAAQPSSVHALPSSQSD